VDLTDEQWAVLEPLLPRRQRARARRGRPWQDARAVLDGVLWILRTGAPWADLPERYPPYQTCHRRFQQWVRAGTWDRMLRALAADLAERGGLDLSEGFIDGTFAGAKKGAPASGRPSGARGPRSWQWQTALVFLSPSASRVLRPTRSRWSTPRSTRALRPRSPRA
jgi:transposase